MTLSSKQLLKLNYAITILIAGYLLYIHVLTPHHVEYPIENIQEIAEKINKSLNYKIIFKEDSKEFNGTKPNGHDLKIDNALTINEYKKEIETFSEYSKVVLEIKCQEESTRKLFFVSNLLPISLSYSGSCNELSASVPLKREFKRFINYLAEDLVSESVLKYHAELFIFDIILIYPIEYKSQIKDITSSIAKTVELFVLELGLESSEYRINIKHHFLEDLPKIQSSLDQDLDIIHELNRELEIDHSSYIFETEKFVFNMIFLNKTGINEDESHHDFLEEKNDKSVTLKLSISSDYEIPLLSSLYRMLELYKFDAGEYLSNSMQKIEFQYDTNILFQQFNASRRQKILKHMMKEIISLIYTLSDPEIIIPEEYGAKIEGLLKNIEKINFSEIKLPDLKRIYREIWSFNHISTKKYGRRDTFPLDYQFGLFLPFLLPIFYPLIQILKNMLLKLKKRK